MIGSLRGTLLMRRAGEVVIDVGGVGYRVGVGARTLAGLGRVGGEVVVYTHLNVREDALALFGFATADERDCFEGLIAAHGVGPALALAIMSVHSPPELRRALAEGDLDALTLVPGVGRKTAARLLIELKARLEVSDLDLGDDDGSASGNGSSANGHGNAKSMSVRADVRSALGGLGYGPEEIASAMRGLPDDGDAQVLLRSALQVIGAGR